MLRVMPETRRRGTGRGSLTREGAGRGMRQSCPMLKGMAIFTGEPCARKPACTVRRGEVGKGLAQIPPEKVSGRSKHHTAPRWPPTLLTMYNEKVINSVQTWLVGFSSMYITKHLIWHRRKHVGQKFLCITGDFVLDFVFEEG